MSHRWIRNWLWEEVVVAQIIEETTQVVVSQEVLDMADDFLESISELFGMTEEHNDNVSTEVFLNLC